MMRNDPIVEEMQAHGREFAAKHGNDIRRICEALRKLETMSGRKVVHREPKRLERKAAS
jgi:transketolase N-terminal domain/subunit